MVFTHWPASMQICENKRNSLYKKRVQPPQDLFGTPIWPPFNSLFWNFNLGTMTSCENALWSLWELGNCLLSWRCHYLSEQWCKNHLGFLLDINWFSIFSSVYKSLTCFDLRSEKMTSWRWRKTRVLNQISFQRLRWVCSVLIATSYCGV